MSKKNSTDNQPGKHDFFLVAQQLRNMVDLEPPEFRSVRRTTPRVTRSLSISVQPLNDDFQPVGDMFWVVSRDISHRGMGLICSEPIEHEFVRTGLLSEHATAISRVCHNTSIGDAYPLYLVGIEFLNNLD